MLKLGRGTTPLYTITFEGISIDDLKDIYITFEQENSLKELTKHFPDVVVDGTKAKVRLTQKETLSFKEGKGKVQIRFINKEDHAYKSDSFEMEVTNALYEGVI